MGQPMPTPITCPNCRQPFNALLEQLVDVGKDPESKQRLISGRINQFVCPHCGFNGTATTPLMYHDPEKELLIAYVPMELGLGQVEQEKLIGDLTKSVMNSLPEEGGKGYLLQPKTALSMQGVIDQVLEADGITKEVIEEQQRMVELIEELADAEEEEQDRLVAENAEMIDRTFFELLRVYANAASQQGDARRSLRLLNLRSRLMETTEIGQEIKAQEEVMAEATQELQSLGERATREDFLDLLINAADNPMKVEALGVLGASLLDYSTFQSLTERANAVEGEEHDQIIAVREKLLEISAAVEQQQRAVVEQAAQTLSSIMQAPDVRTAIQQNVRRIDDTFMSVLQANLDEASRTGNIQASAKLKEIRDEVLSLIQASAPPEVQFINDLLATEDATAARELLIERQSEVNETLVGLMHDLSGQLRQAGNEEAAHILDILHDEAVNMVQPG